MRSQQDIAPGPYFANKVVILCKVKILSNIKIRHTQTHKPWDSLISPHCATTIPQRVSVCTGVNLKLSLMCNVAHTRVLKHAHMRI